MVEKVDCVEFERAFEVLLEEGEKLLQQIRQRGAEALLEGDHHFTDWANQRSRALDEALKTLRDFQKNVKIILHGRSAVPSSPQPAPRRRRRRGTGIPQSEYMPLILVDCWKWAAGPQPMRCVNVCGIGLKTSWDRTTWRDNRVHRMYRYGGIGHAGPEMS